MSVDRSEGMILCFVLWYSRDGPSNVSTPHKAFGFEEFLVTKLNVVTMDRGQLWNHDYIFLHNETFDLFEADERRHIPGSQSDEGRCEPVTDRRHL